MKTESKQQAKSWFHRNIGGRIYSVTGDVEFTVANLWHANHLYWLQEACGKRYISLYAKERTKTNYQEIF